MKPLPDWPFRSLLFVPANREDFVRKAARFAPEAVILDLEDAVPADHKLRARDGVRALVEQLCEAGIAAFVRVNAFEEGGQDDLAAVVCPQLRGVVLPKVKDGAEVAAVDRLLSYHEGRQGVPHGQVDIVGLPETAAGLRDPYAIATGSRRVKALMTPVSGPMGGDVARAVGYRPTSEGLEQLYVASKVVLDCRAAGAAFPVAGIIGAAVDDAAAVGRLIERARALGFTGAALVHPGHVAMAHAAFRPTAEDVGSARALLQAFEQAAQEGRGAFRFQGAMVDLAMVGGAREIVAEADRIATRGTQA